MTDPLPQFERCVLCVVHCIQPNSGRRAVPDYDNIELKAVQDLLALFLMVDDSMRYCDRYETACAGDLAQTEFHILRPDAFPAWLVQQNSRKREV